MAKQKRTDDHFAEEAVGTPVEVTGGKVVDGANFNSERLINFIKDWKQTRAEIKRCHKTYVLPLQEHLRDGKRLAKEAGFNPEVMMEIVKDLEEEPDRLREVQELRDFYRFHLQLVGGAE